MSATTISSDKPPRKQLSEQLDRLDGILDALSDGLNGAVAEAAREGTLLAVKDAIVEILTDPTLRAQLYQASAPEPAPERIISEGKPSLWTRLKAHAKQAIQSVTQTVLGGARAVAETTSDVVRSGQCSGRVKKLILIGLGVGLTLGVASYVAPHTIAAVLSGISGAVTAAVVQIGVWMRRTVRALSLA